MRLLFLGDSITEGITESLGRAMLSLGVEADIFSSVGIDVDGVAENTLVKQRLARHPEAVVVMLGTNPYGIVDAVTFRRSVFGLLRLVWKTTDQVAWIGPWAGIDSDQRLRVIRELLPVRSADGAALAVGLDRAGEGNVHFTTSAYQILGRRVAEWTARRGYPRILTRTGRAGRLMSVLALGAAAVAPIAPEVREGRWP